ncbi:methyltransferase domain-containing protein [Tsukamurella paurometabola]|uniref:methyltransferase domain-containing protein n=1 Tax=Tsukamurella paurometabola TaxID=2061 RepID=UPI000F7EAB2D|nr:methyltransferase domain-containing protein [Tsukamurella paurometabola]UEA83990.1 methyltransferase domain-containing protein [Tsukamurella paurometabola]
MGESGSSWAERMSTASVDGFVTALDRQGRMDVVRATREWVRARLAIGPGSTVIDVGCGTGDELGELTRLVAPGGRAIGLDLNPPMAHVARRRLSRAEGVLVAAGEATALPVPDGAVDAVVCERVLQHLGQEPADAVREYARAVRGDGIVALTDSDWSSLEIRVDDDERATRRLLDVRARVRLPFTANQGAGGRLGDYLEAAGLTVLDRRATVLTDFAPELVQGVAAGVNASAAQALSASDLADVRSTVDDALARGALRIAVPFHAVVARR